MEPKFRRGDDVFVREPGAKIAGVQSITGPILAVWPVRCGVTYLVRTTAVWETSPMRFRQERSVMVLSEASIGLRMGTPINQLSGRPGHAGFEEFSRIARSWGYD